ncbi:hypothetical protein [Sphingobacterium spiritivorum]|uniref:hypothetical protein n=1 Tax=Sphingobacterium spiritivorum TaxID=258 RepID=UPI003DA54F66
MKKNLEHKKMTPEKITKLMNGGKQKIDNEEATKILLFLKNMARIVIRKYLEK